jgi:RpiB/LacA/LacB family sugar-phosphate isomerase
MKKYNLLVPMAGRGQRFINEGYKVPKQLLHVKDKQLIDISLSSVETSECNLIFVVRDDQITNFQIDKVLQNKYGDDVKIVVTDGLTDGSVCSCLLAEEYIDNEMPLVIHTLDIQFFPVLKPDELFSQDDDGVLLTFKSNSSNYSYVSIDESGRAIKTAEKKVISPNACVGIYAFARGFDFCKYARKMIELDLRTNGEFYISPLYNLLIEDGLKITTSQVDKMHIFGTPKEFEFYKNNVVKTLGEKPIALCSDHSGYDAKNNFKKILTEAGIEFIDFGTNVKTDCDYTYYIEQAVSSIRDKTCDFAFSFCRTGQGVNMCANKFHGVRSALVYDEFSAEMAVRHNCANFFSFPERIFIDEEKCKLALNILLENTFDGGRHQIRVQGLENEDI